MRCLAISVNICTCEDRKYVHIFHAINKSLLSPNFQQISDPPLNLKVRFCHTANVTTILFQSDGN